MDQINFAITNYEKIVQEKKPTKGDIMPGITGFMRCAKFGDFALQNQINNLTPYLDLSKELDLKVYRTLKRCYELFIAYNAIDEEDMKVIISPQNQLIAAEFDKWVSDSPAKRTYYQWSAHDTTLGPHLQIMKVMNLQCIVKDLNEGTYTESCPGMPTVASNIVWELIKKPASVTNLRTERFLQAEDQYQVKVSFN